MADSFVYESTEVKKTGRIAVRKIGRSQKEQKLVEIEPVDDGGWKKWVDETLLYVVESK